MFYLCLLMLSEGVHAYLLTFSEQRCKKYMNTTFENNRISSNLQDNTIYATILHVFYTKPIQYCCKAVNKHPKGLFHIKTQS